MKVKHQGKENSKGKKNVEEFPRHLQHINIHAAGIDVGSRSHFVAVPEKVDEECVREFKAFTSDLHRLADWLEECGIETVVMESTGVYWIPLFELLEARGFEVKLVNARHVKNVPGRKTDVLDCQWLQQLHTYGLLEGAFRPPEQICALRSYLRQRANMVRYAASHIQHMQKALNQMNVMLHIVVNDITGVTGMKIIRAILQGERDPHVLASFRDRRCKEKEATIAKALEGNYRAEHMFSLKQAVEMFDVYQEKIAQCDREIEDILNQFGGKIDIENKPLPPQSKKHRPSRNEPKFDLRSHLYRITGVDLTRIDGITAYGALTIISEIGVDMSPWKTEKQFASWLGLCPGNKVSGGKQISGKSKPTANRAASALRLAAQGLYNSRSALGAFLRRQKSRLGAPKAITATAHKLARLVYTLLKYGTEYVDAGQNYYEEQYRQRVIYNLKRRARQMGLLLIEKETGAIA